MHPLIGNIQHYAWGGMDFIPRLLHQENPDRQPCAEYWLGAHVLSPSTVELSGEKISLNAYIAQAPEKILGGEVFKTFGCLPYLLKILDVREMLSIQVHPSRKQAEEGFERENQLGIPLSAPHRNYKDANHKPEMMYALSEFYLLHGFRLREDLMRVLETEEILSPLIPVFESRGYEGLYRFVMELSQEAVDQFLGPLADKLWKQKEAGVLTKNDPGYWAAKSLQSQGEGGWKNLDKGLFSVYFFNLVKLDPGEVIFQGAGLPHAYLEGQNVELMANSDNVLRGGLTPKNIDVPELLKLIRYEGIDPVRVTGKKTGVETKYQFPVPDFGFSILEMDKGERHHWESTSMEILFCLQGEGQINEETAGGKIRQGEAQVLDGSEKTTVEALSSLVLARAFVP